MSEPSPIAAADLSPRRAWALALLIAATLFASVVPTLNWLQFASGNENLVVQAALEMRHGGPKLLPSLMGVPRVKKPPLVTWLTAAAMRPETVDQLSDMNRRDGAYRDLAWQVRWPALVAACVLTLAAFETARVWAGGLAGVMTALVVCTNYLFLKYMRQATTDAHLAAWVAVANACFAHGLLRGRWWIAATAGAVATGFAFMCKGPVALAETVLPTVVMALALRGSPSPRAANNAGTKNAGKLRWIGPVVVGLFCFSLVALPWFIYVLRQVPDVAATWTKEVGRSGATTLEAGNPIVYLELGFLTAPWIVFGVVGLLTLWGRRREPAAWLPMLFAVAPLLLMVWVRDRKERYMLPMIAPAAMICGYGVAVWVRSWRSRRTAANIIVLAVHTLILLGAAVTLGVYGSGEKQLDGTVWFSQRILIWGGVALLAFVGLTAVAQRRRAWAVPAASFVLMLALLTAYNCGYRDTAHGRSPLKPLADAILAEAPDAAVYDWVPRGRVDEQVAIYLNKTILKADPATLRPTDRPIVLITRLSRRDEPTVLPAEWELLATANEGPVKWSAYLRRPRSPLP